MITFKKQSGHKSTLIHSIFTIYKTSYWRCVGVLKVHQIELVWTQFMQNFGQKYVNTWQSYLHADPFNLKPWSLIKIGFFFFSYKSLIWGDFPLVSEPGLGICSIRALMRSVGMPLEFIPVHLKGVQWCWGAGHLIFIFAMKCLGILSSRTYWVIGFFTKALHNSWKTFHF